MTISHAGASEIYLNGKLIKRSGVVSQNPDEIVACNPHERPLSFPVSKPGEQVLAVRYTLEPHVSYTGEWDTRNHGLFVKINSFENANAFYYNTQDYNKKSTLFRISAYIVLAVLYLAFYISDRRQRTSLNFFIYALIWTFIWTLHFSMDVILPPVRYIYLWANISLVVQVMGWVFCLAAIYALLGIKRNWIFYSVVMIGLVSIPLGLFVYTGWFFYAAVAITVFTIEVTRVAVLASQRKRKGARIIAIGGMLALFSWILFMLSDSISLSPFLNKWFLFALNHLTIPVAVFIYIGYDFALTNKSLEQKLVEVQTLSQEKGKILSTQNEMLEKQVSARTAELNQSLNELKSTQSQLVQSEKMASLGELTAGIAHEIQNPLNFVNNFSALNTELIDELQQELKAGNVDDVIALSNDIKSNEQKINHHGKRADSIVKGMLQHSRRSTGLKEQTDINELVDEYLRLAYHGLRAKDKSFDASLKTNWDTSIGQIQIVPQDTGRVILNLVTNAFYAVAEKKKQNPDDFIPTVTITTKKIGEKVRISIQDNGNGIPQKILDKIFQPFFTTKPTGQGTGLGLSLSYDIVKAHGGELTVETKEGEGSVFNVIIPVT
jgi:signal transduction histidine kinase